MSIKRMQAARPQGFHVAEALSMLALPSALILFTLSAIFETPGVLAAAPKLAARFPGLLATNALLSLLTDVTCDASLRVRALPSFQSPYVSLGRLPLSQVPRNNPLARKVLG